MTVTQQESEAIRAARARRRDNNQRAADDVVVVRTRPYQRGPIVWYGTTPDNTSKSGVLERSEVEAFVTHCLVDGWSTLAVYDGGVFALGGIEQHPRRLWLTKEAIA